MRIYIIEDYYSLLGTNQLKKDIIKAKHTKVFQVENKTLSLDSSGISVKPDVRWLLIIWSFEPLLTMLPLKIVAYVSMSSKLICTIIAKIEVSVCIFSVCLKSHHVDKIKKKCGRTSIRTAQIYL